MLKGVCHEVFKDRGKDRDTMALLAKIYFCLIHRGCSTKVFQNPTSFALHVFSV